MDNEKKSLIVVVGVMVRKERGREREREREEVGNWSLLLFILCLSSWRESVCLPRERERFSGKKRGSTLKSMGWYRGSEAVS